MTEEQKRNAENYIATVKREYGNSKCKMKKYPNWNHIIDPSTGRVISRNGIKFNKTKNEVANQSKVKMDIENIIKEVSSLDNTINNLRKAKQEMCDPIYTLNGEKYPAFMADGKTYKEVFEKLISELSEFRKETETFLNEINASVPTMILDEEACEKTHSSEKMMILQMENLQEQLKGEM